ncbi:hypothetical protein SEPCBS119000_006750, partial [Sporothrix epigloea]
PRAKQRSSLLKSPPLLGRAPALRRRTHRCLPLSLGRGLLPHSRAVTPCSSMPRSCLSGLTNLASPITVIAGIAARRAITPRSVARPTTRSRSALLLRLLKTAPAMTATILRPRPLIQKT